MEFNIDKCKIMNIGNSNRQFRYYINDRELSMATEEKDPDVRFSDNLKFSRHSLESYKRAQ